MAKKLDGAKALEYGVKGAGALVIPTVVQMVPQITAMLSNVPFVGQPLWQGISLLGILTAGLGVGLVDQLLYNK